jgi:hypothetical protein
MVARVISGGQTGVDQAALRAAAALGIAIGGWCPPGGCPTLSPLLRKGGSESPASENAVIREQFPLTQTPADRSPSAPEVPRSQRTEWNVRDSDGTLLLLSGDLDRADAGTRWTADCAKKYRKPIIMADPSDLPAIAHIRQWIKAHHIKTLNIAGPSESSSPGIGALAEKFVTAVLSLDALYQETS